MVTAKPASERVVKTARFSASLALAIT